MASADQGIRHRSLIEERACQKTRIPKVPEGGNIKLGKADGLGEPDHAPSLGNEEDPKSAAGMLAGALRGVTGLHQQWMSTMPPVGKAGMTLASTSLSLPAIWQCCTRGQERKFAAYSAFARSRNGRVD